MRSIILITCWVFFLAACNIPKIPYVVGQETIYEKNKDPFVNSILDASKKEFKHSEEVIILYTPLDYGKRFKGLLYNIETHQRYYFLNEQSESFDVFRTEKNSRFNTIDYLLQYYINGKIDFLKSIQQKISDGGVVINVYDINFQTKITKVYHLENILLDENGNPTTLKKMNLDKHRKQ